MFTLYHFTTCPYCLKVRAAIKKMGIPVQTKNIHKEDSALQELLAGGGRKQVPCLRIHREGQEDEWMYESNDIIAYLHQRTIL